MSIKVRNVTRRYMSDIVISLRIIGLRVRKIAVDFFLQLLKNSFL